MSVSGNVSDRDPSHREILEIVIAVRLGLLTPYDVAAIFQDAPTYRHAVSSEAVAGTHDLSQRLRSARDGMDRRVKGSGRRLEELVGRILEAGASDVRYLGSFSDETMESDGAVSEGISPTVRTGAGAHPGRDSDASSDVRSDPRLFCELDPDVRRVIFGESDTSELGVGRWSRENIEKTSPVMPEDPQELASIAWMDDWNNASHPGARHAGNAAAVESAGEDSTTPEEFTSRYHVVRRLARGGLGEIFEAKDRELNRWVAIKRLRPERNRSRVCRRRLEMEAIVTGALEHPGIVPVYGLGIDAVNQPFYSMRLVGGVTLLHAIQSLDPRRSESSPTTPRWTTRRLLVRFRSVCETVSYAHKKGFWHRDLKPENILLGSHGETLVLDWGLARPVTGHLRNPDDPNPFPSASGSESGTESETGSAPADAGKRVSLMGTPSYMSPEQARGDGLRIGLQSDVYSLGATLYHILTGKPPFQGWTAEETVMLVGHGQFLRPRQRNRNIDPALEAICLKAMQWHPKDRYPSAQALGDDIERYLAEEPVSVFHESRLRRFSRWQRRRRPWLAGCVAVLAISVLGLILGSIALKRERDRTDLARRDAVTARDRGEESRRRARAAIKTYLQAFSEKLREQSGAQPIRHQLLSQAVDYYQLLLAENSENPDNISSGESAEVLSALVGLGSVQEELGEISKAQETYLRAIPMAQRLLTTANPAVATSGDPDSVRTEIQSGLAQAYNNYGNLLLKFQKPSDAILQYQNSQHIYESLASAKGRLYVDREVARIWNNLANCYNQMKDYPQAAACYEKAVVLCENDNSKDNIRYLHDFAALRSNYCDCLIFLKDTDRAYKELTQSRQLIQKVLAREPQNPWYQYLGNLTKCIEARYYSAVGNPQLCLAAWDAAWTGQKQLAQENQGVGKFRVLFFKICKDRANAYVYYKNNNDSLIEGIYRDWIQSAALPVPVADAGDLDPDWVLNSFQSRGLFALWLNQNRQFQRAFGILETLRNEADQLPRDKWSDPLKTVFAGFQNGTYANIAMALDGLGRFDEALPYWRLAMVIDDPSKFEQLAFAFLIDTVRSGNFSGLHEFRANLLKKGDPRGFIWYNLALTYTYKFSENPTSENANVIASPNKIADAAEREFDLQDAGSTVLLCLQRARHLGWFRSDDNRRGFLVEPRFLTFQRDQRFVRFTLDVLNEFAFP